jgi:hypothetical protein
MKIFISWSGERSRVIANSLRVWLGDVIQFVSPWMSDQDIDKGAWWTAQIAHELESSAFGIICVTKENASAPWLLFEAGVLAKSLEKGRVCPYLFSMKPTELTGPLANFQAATTTKEDTLQLLQSINKALGANTRTDEQVEKGFRKWWPELEKMLADVPPLSLKHLPPQRSDRDLLEEVLTLARRLSLGSTPGPEIKPFLDSGDLDAFASVVDLIGDSEDPNAADWGPQSQVVVDDPLDGYWSSRWNVKSDVKGWRTSLAFVKRMDKFIFILELEGKAPTPFLICARQDRQRLIGRYVNLLRTADSTPWAGLLVDNDRIDGEWKSGRWDFRRAKTIATKPPDDLAG